MDIPHYAKPLSPGRMLEGPAERFQVRQALNSYVPGVWIVWDRAKCRQAPTIPTRFYAEGSALASARNLNRGRA